MDNVGKHVRINESHASGDEEERSTLINHVGRIKPALTDNRETLSGDKDDDVSSDGASSDDSRSEEGNTTSHDEPSSSPSYSSGSPSGSATPEIVRRRDARPEESEAAINAARNEKMDKVLESISFALSRFQENPRPQRNDDRDADADEGWGFSNNVNASRNESSSSNIRWDHIKPFPSGIPANKMWEEWNRYIENFEIAASLSNVNDPAKRTQLLFLSMGNSLQGIVNAAKLRPSLKKPTCYTTFVTNIQNYLCSMTDTAAEHEAFSRMRQENGESAISFHARLMCKVRSCKYSADDEDRFVRSQLLSGLRNRELVKQAKTYGYITNFIVQSATRDEAFATETRQQEEPTLEPTAFEVRSTRRQPPMFHGKRKYTNMRGGPPAKLHRSGEVNQRSQGRPSPCQRCGLLRHRNGVCPALSRSCDECGKRGHFAAVCRQKQVNFLQDRRNINPPEYKDEDRYEDNKQVYID